MCNECRVPHGAEPDSRGRHGAAYRLSVSTLGIASRRDVVTTLLAVTALVGIIVLVHSLLGSNNSKVLGPADRVFVQDLRGQAASAIDITGKAGLMVNSPRVTALARRLLDGERQQLVRLHAAAGSSDLHDSASRPSLTRQSRGVGRVSGASLIDGYIRHAQDDVITARIELTSGESQPLKRLAYEVRESEISTIRHLNQLRTAWYGDASPSGSVPGGVHASKPEPVSQEVGGIESASP